MKLNGKEKIEVYNSKLLGWLLIIIGMAIPIYLILVGMPLIFWKNLFFPFIIAPFFIVLNGISVFVRPYFSIDENRLILYSMFWIWRVYKFQSVDNLLIQRNNFWMLKLRFVNEEGKSKIIPIMKIAINRYELKDFIRLIS